MPPEVAIPTKPVPTVDSHYCNPNAQIIIISKDNVAFKADAWYMAKKRSGGFVSAGLG